MTSSHVSGRAWALAVGIGLAAGACRSDDRDNGNNIIPPPPGTVSCPGEGLSVCDLKLDDSSEHPAAGDPIVLENVVVTTPTIAVSKSMDVVTIAGFFVQDQETSETLNGQYSGILVTYNPELLGAKAPALFDVVTVTGIYDTYGREGFEPQKQVEAADISNSGTKGTIAPIEIERADLIATGGEKAAQYEGVLVKVNETTITTTDVQPNGMPIYGAFVVDQSLIVVDTMFEYTNPVVNEVFTSIAGVLRLGTAPFDGGQYMLAPRFAADVVPKNAAQVVRTIRDIQDASAPGHPQEGCSNLNGNETIGKCATAELQDVVVTAVGGYVSTNLRAIYVQDDRVADGRFAGVKIVYNPDRSAFVPTRGMRINVTGQIIDYRRGTQIQYPEIEQAGTTMTEVQPVVVSAQDVARTTAPEGSPYEGVLVKIENATVTSACLEDTQERDHGNWIVDGVVYVGSQFQYGYNGELRPSGTMCLTPEGEPTGACSCDARSRPNDQRMMGDTFQSIAGIPDFAFNEYQLQPRDSGDLVR